MQWSRSTYAWIVVAWSLVAVVLAWLHAPAWLSFPIVGTFALLGVGCAVLIATRIHNVPIALCVIMGTGVSSLIIASELVMYMHQFSALRTLLLEAFATLLICGWILRNDVHSLWFRYVSEKRGRAPRGQS